MQDLRQEDCIERNADEDNNKMYSVFLVPYVSFAPEVLPRRQQAELESVSGC